MVENETAIWNWGKAIIRNGELILDVDTDTEHSLGERLEIFDDKKSLDVVIVLRQKIEKNPLLSDKSLGMEKIIKQIIKTTVKSEALR